MSKIRKSAKNEMCQVRIPGHCRPDPETTILAHINGGGMGMKQPDFLGSYSCHRCHAVLDGVTRTEYPPQLIELWHWQGVGRTLKILEAKGLITCA